MSRGEPSRLSPVLFLPVDQRPDFATPRGLLYHGDLGPVLADAREPLVCVGDVVSRYCSALGRRHVILVVDHVTRRGELIEWGEETGFRRVHVWNPRGALSLEAIDLLCRLTGERDRWLVSVEGEEDMIALAALSCMDKGTLVYGVPPRRDVSGPSGAAVIHASRSTRLEAQSRMLSLRPGLAPRIPL